jgi:CBS domain-containing protein
MRAKMIERTRERARAADESVDASRAVNDSHESSTCLCRDVLAQAARRCRTQHPSAAHYAVFHCAVVKDILDSTNHAHTAFGRSHWIDGAAKLSDGLRQMYLTDLSALVVMDRDALDADRSGVITEEELALSAANDAIIGIISERDYLNAVARGVVDVSTTVRDVMTSFRDASTTSSARLVCVSPSDSVLAAMETMTKHRLRHVPVIASEGIDPMNGRPIKPRVLGVVSLGEVLKTLLAESRSEIHHLESYISGVE